MFRRLIAKITGWPLVLVAYGLSHHHRFVRVDGDGISYVIVNGEVLRNRTGYYKWIPVANCSSENLK